MNRFYIFCFRAILGVIFAVILTRIFYPGAELVWVIGGAFGLVSLAYITESFRHRERDKQGKGEH